MKSSLCVSWAAVLSASGFRGCHLRVDRALVGLKLSKSSRRGVNTENIEHCPTSSMNRVPLLGELVGDFLYFVRGSVGEQGRRLSRLRLDRGALST